MDTEDLFPRLALAGGLIAAVLVYRRQRMGRLKKAQASLATMPQDAVDRVAEGGVSVSKKSQSLIEGVLDNIAEQALKELKVVLKDGLKRLEKTVDAI